MAKTYLIETRQTFIIGYAVTMDDDMDPKTIAGKIIAEEMPTELYQYDVGEQFEQCIPTSEQQIPKIFRAKNEYLSKVFDDDHILEYYVLDYRTNKEEE